MHGMNGFSSLMGFGWIIGVAILVALVWVIIRFMRPGQIVAAKNDQSPLDILSERYIRGEIEKDEYLEKKKNIS